MAHQVQAFVGARTILELIQRQFALSCVIDLEQGLALLPLSDELYDAIPGDLTTPAQKGFVLLSPKIEALLKETSTYGVVGYFETKYFGGRGDQGALLAQLGKVTFGPQVGADSINQMLKLLGARRQGDGDEFDTIGLGKYGSNTAWIDHPVARASAETMTLTGSIISWIHGFGKK
jgi:hypothetical protein